jgi:beta-galactosidase
LSGARWIICPTAGGVEPSLWEELRRATHEGARVTAGPRVPHRDGSLRPLAEPLDKTDFHVIGAMARHPYFDRAAVDAHVKATIDELELPTWPTSPNVALTVHEDVEGRPRVLFLINATAEKQRAAFDLGFAANLADMLDGSRHACKDGRLAISMPPRQVLMLKIDLA